MIVIAGYIIIKDNKVLMVKEANKKCYGKWNFPAGYVDGAELITDASIAIQYIKDFEDNNIYPVEVFNNKIFSR